MSINENTVRPSVWGPVARGLLSVLGGIGALSQMGCLMDRVDLVKSGTVRIERAIPKSLSMSAPRVWQDDGEMIVYGQVRRSPSASGIIRGHIDVTVIDRDGKVLQTASRRHFPGDVPTRRWHGSSFTVKFAGVPPPGSTVRVVYHSGPEHPD